MKIGLCIIGCGNFSRTFAESIRPLTSEINLYFASRDANKAQVYNSTFGGHGSFGSYEEAVGHPDVTAVYICTPHHLHLEHAVLAASHKKHILIEKPIARTSEEAQQMVAISNHFQINLMVAENYRFIPAIRLCKKLINQGAIGRIRVVQIQQESPYLPSEWRAIRSKNGGGVFIDAGDRKRTL